VVCEAIHADVSVLTLLDALLSKPKGEYRCEYCDKCFVSPQSKYQHKQRCQSSKQSDTFTEDRLSKLEAELDKLKSNQIGNTQNNIQINVNTNTGQLKVRNFGCENMEALPIQLLETLFLDLKFRELLENLHCDPDYPENHNVRIKSTKRELMEIYRNNKWDVVTFVNGLDELLMQGHRIFKDYYRKNKDKILEDDMDEEDLKNIWQQLCDIERLSEENVKPLRKELQLMLESHRSNQLVAF
jgi:hypothetical protein